MCRQNASISLFSPFRMMGRQVVLGGKSKSTEQEESAVLSQQKLSEFLVMADGGKSDRLNEESLPTCSSFSGRGNRKWWSSWGEKMMYIAVQRQSYDSFWIISTLQTPVTSAHCLSSQSSSAVCLSVRLQDLTSFLTYVVTDDSHYVWHPVRAITVPFGKDTPALTYTLGEWDIIDIKTGTHKN